MGNKNYIEKANENYVKLLQNAWAKKFSGEVYQVFHSPQCISNLVTRGNVMFPSDWGATFVIYQVAYYSWHITCHYAN